MTTPAASPLTFLDIDNLSDHWDRAYLQSAQMRRIFTRPLAESFDAMKGFAFNKREAPETVFDRLREEQPNFWRALMQKIAHIPNAAHRASGLAFVYVVNELGECAGVSEAKAVGVVCYALSLHNLRAPINSAAAYRVAKHRYNKR